MVAFQIKSTSTTTRSTKAPTSSRPEQPSPSSADLSLPNPQQSSLFDNSSQNFFASHAPSASPSLTSHQSPNSNAAPLPSPYDPSVPSWLYGENFLYSHLSGSTTTGGGQPLPLPANYAANPYGSHQMWGLPPQEPWAWTGFGTQAGADGAAGGEQQMRSRATTEDGEDDTR
jgi:hypothetical protein